MASDIERKKFIEDRVMPFFETELPAIKAKIERLSLAVDAIMKKPEPKEPEKGTKFSELLTEPLVVKKKSIKKD